MKKVTYVIGAGASIGCIPIVNQMASYISDLLIMFDEKYKNEEAYTVSDDYSKIEIDKELMWLQDKCSEHLSIDTYAKNLFTSKTLKGAEELRRLKNILTLYFTLIQKIIASDKRYAHFWANILNDKDKLPNQIRILSWNYDFQFETSYKQAMESPLTLNEIGEKLNVKSIYSDYTTVNPAGFNIFKLNGSAKLLRKEKGKNKTAYIADDFNPKTYEGFFKRFFRAYDLLKPNDMKTDAESWFSEISFAWEHDFDSGYFKKIKESIIDTSTLVVIGYSFPMFNRRVDKLLMHDWMPDLNTVHFQAPHEHIQEIMGKFRAFNNKIPSSNIGLHENTAQFFLPSELDI